MCVSVCACAFVVWHTCALVYVCECVCVCIWRVAYLCLLLAVLTDLLLALDLVLNLAPLRIHRRGHAHLVPVFPSALIGQRLVRALILIRAE